MKKKKTNKNEYLKIVLNSIEFDLFGDILLIVFVIGIGFYFWSSSRLLSFLSFLIVVIKVIGLKYG